MDGNGSPIQVIIFLRNDMILEKNKQKLPMEQLEPMGLKGKGAFFLCMCERVGFGASASSIFYVRMLKWKGTRGGSFLGLLHPWVRGRWRAFSIFFFFVFLLQLSEEERITRVGWVLLNVWPAGLVGVVFFLFSFLFSASWLLFFYLTRLKFRLSL